MNQYFRYLSFLLLTAWSAQAFALDEIDRFAKRCDFYTQQGFGADSLAALKKDRNELRNAKVPIRMSFADCESIKYIVDLKNSAKVTIESAYPTNGDPDVKGLRFDWNPASPSPRFWYFTYGGWEDVGWVLIDKMSGQKIESKTECDPTDFAIGENLLAVVCTGIYENQTPTVYMVDIKKTKEIWSKPITIEKCNENSSFVSRRFEFVNRSTFSLEGDCHLSTVRGKEMILGKKWAKVKFMIQISEDSLKVKSNGVTEKVDWDSAK